MKETFSKLKSYQYPIMDITLFGDMDMVTSSGLSPEEMPYDRDENQGEWD